MHRFFCPQADFSLTELILTDKNEIHHIHNVLRLQKADEIFVFDGKGKEAKGKISAISAKSVTIEIISHEHIKKNTPTIILACAIPKKGKFELIIEKATELGVDEIYPIKTHRTEIILDKKRADKKTNRYQMVAINAAKQSKRPTIPRIHPITPFNDAIKELTQNSTVIIPSLLGKRKNLITALNELKSPQTISFFIGPEGDFTEEEYGNAQKQGCIPVTLGETILRVETAAISVIACTNSFFAHDHIAAPQENRLWR